MQQRHAHQAKIQRPISLECNSSILSMRFQNLYCQLRNPALIQLSFLTVPRCSLCLTPYHSHFLCLTIIQPRILCLNCFQKRISSQEDISKQKFYIFLKENSPMLLVQSWTLTEQLIIMQGLAIYGTNIDQIYYMFHKYSQHKTKKSLQEHIFQYYFCGRQQLETIEQNFMRMNQLFQKKQNQILLRCTQLLNDDNMIKSAKKVVVKQEDQYEQGSIRQTRSKYRRDRLQQKQPQSNQQQSKRLTKLKKVAEKQQITEKTNQIVRKLMELIKITKRRKKNAKAYNLCYNHLRNNFITNYNHGAQRIIAQLYSTDENQQKVDELMKSYNKQLRQRRNVQKCVLYFNLFNRKKRNLYFEGLQNFKQTFTKFKPYMKYFSQPEQFHQFVGYLYQYDQLNKLAAKFQKGLLNKVEYAAKLKDIEFQRISDRLDKLIQLENQEDIPSQNQLINEQDFLKLLKKSTKPWADLLIRQQVYSFIQKKISKHPLQQDNLDNSEKYFRQNYFAKKADILKVHYYLSLTNKQYTKEQ